MNPPALLRTFLAADLEACLGVFDSNVPNAFLPNERSQFEAFLQDLPGPYLVLEESAGVIACGGYAFEDDGETVSLCWGMVARRRQGEGHGRRLLLARVEAALADPRCRVIRLGTTKPVASFFEKMGFTIVEFHDDPSLPGGISVEMLWRRHEAAQQPRGPDTP